MTDLDLAEMREALDRPLLEQAKARLGRLGASCTTPVAAVSTGASLDFASRPSLDDQITLALEGGELYEAMRARVEPKYSLSIDTPRGMPRRVRRAGS